MEPTLEASPSSTSIKRKLDEAFDALDYALHPREGRPSPPKRANTSIYGSLAKFGIRNLKPSTSKAASTPTLTALLSRSRTQKHRKQLSIPQFSKTSSATPDYSPCSTEAFLQRLSTFNLSTYPSKPPQIDAVAASKSGWINEGGKDRLFCAICKVGWVIAGRDGLNKDAANSLVEKQRHSLVGMHKEGCPWRVRQCDSLVYRIPLQSPTGLARQIKSRAAELDQVMDGIAIRHPLTSTQVQSFLQTVASVPDPTSSFAPSSTPSQESQQYHTTLPSPPSLLASLFGWSLVPAPPPLFRPSSSASLTLARTHSRASSVQSFAGPSRESTPAPGAFFTPTPFNTPTKDPGTPFGTPINGKGKAPDSPAASPRPMLSHCEPPRQKDAMLQCQMCQRRVGLWAFAVPNPSTSSTPVQNSSANTNATSRPQRHLDFLREHRSYCPYVVKSTPLPSLPSYAHTPAPTPRSSFNLTRSGTSTSLSERQNSTSSSFNLRRTTSLLSGASSFARTGSLSSIPPPPPPSEQNHNIVEGWRAVLSVVLRYGIAERSRVRAHPSSSSGSAPGSATAPGSGTESVTEHEGEDEDDAMSGVVALVEGVKQHGGKQLLSYVRGLLG